TDWVTKSLRNFPSVLMSGGTGEGISKVVANAARVLKATSQKQFHAIGYLAGASVLNESHDSHASSQDAAYGAGWSLQMWIDLLAEGIKPEMVKVLGIGGGKIAAFEYSLALALGATVGIVADTDRAAEDFMKDDLWRK